LECIERPNKSSICGLPGTNGGYFIFVNDADHQMHVVFNRWD